MIIEQNVRNIVNFDFKKTEAILFITVKKNLLIKLVEDNKLSIESKKIKFNINTIRQLNIMLDSGFKLKVYVNQKIEKTRNAVVRIQGIIGKYGFALRFTRKIYIAAIYSIILYGAEI